MTDDTGELTLGAAKAPRGVGTAPLVGQLVALLLVAAGAVGIVETLIAAGAVDGPSWVGRAAAAVDGTRSGSAAVLAAAVALLLVGLVVLPTAFRRRPRTTVSLAAQTGVFLRSDDLGRLLLDALEGTDDITEVTVLARPRRVKVAATTYGPPADDQRIRDDVTSRLAPTLDQLHRTPRVRVRLKHRGDER